MFYLGIPGVMNMLVTATGDTTIIEKVAKLSNSIIQAGVRTLFF